MGGGDLNLKKSWHPSTLRNIERVWKAEQKHEVEKQKIEQLQKELAEERAREEIQAYAQDQGVVRKREERLDWMYQGPAAMVNRDDYLMGRKIDKTLELLQQEESGIVSKNDDFDVGSSMFSSQDLSGTATVDLANKIREDPLFSIMKKEKEQRKSLLSNPVKMKQLQQLLQKSISKEKKKSKKSYTDTDSKHHKKQKKEKQSSYSSDEDETITKRSRDHHRKEKRSIYSSDEDETITKRSRDHHRKEKRSTYSSDEDETIAKRSRDYHRQEKHSTYSSDEDQTNAKRSRNHHKKIKHFSPPEDTNKKHYRRDSTPVKDKYHATSSSRDKDQYHSSRYVNNHSSREISLTHPFRQNNFDNRNNRKIDEEERERRLKEMEENARWREEQRVRKVRRYKDEVEREEEAQKIDPSDFIKPMLSKAANKGSLEKRVRQKIFSIQRSSGDMDKHFARR